MSRFSIIALCGSTLLLGGCYEMIFKRQDMENVRRQFHLPKAAIFSAFDSNPNTPGFFGREGLRIQATIYFPEAVLDEYIAHLNDPLVWGPVAYLHYSPSIADEYSEAALRWKDLPLPDSIESRVRQQSIIPKWVDARKGKYYCSAILGVRGKPLTNNPSGYQWKNVGRSCSELKESEYPTIRAFAIIDYDKKTLHVQIQFSG